ncbi:MAG TPA: DUF2917 domain-containing protein [Noviherbaspirillum sp.]|nr:DUF2917 domain-containing protein [Noviherbaspirillum sp.]
MRGIFTIQSLVLESGQAVSGVADKAQLLRILQGRVWLTVEGISHDYWLSAGDSFTAMPGRLIVVEADHGGSRMDIVSTQQPAMLKQFSKRIRSAAQRLAFGKAPSQQPCPLAHCQQ